VLVITVLVITVLPGVTSASVLFSIPGTSSRAQ